MWSNLLFFVGIFAAGVFMKMGDAGPVKVLGQVFTRNYHKPFLNILL
jgi:hypothetical protein